MTRINHDVRHALARMAGWSGLLAVALIAAGWLPARAAAGNAGVLAVALGVAFALAGGLIGSYLSASALALPAAQRPGTLFAALGARFAATMVFAMGGRFSGLLTPMPFLVAIAAGHLAFLAVDMAVLARVQRAAGVGEAK